MENVMVVPTEHKVHTDKIGLIDADFIKYLVVWRIHKDIESGRAHVSNPIADYTKEYIGNLTSAFDSPMNIFCFSGSSSQVYRSHVAVERKYKGNRTYEEKYPGEAKDKLAVVDYISERYPSLIFKDLEADDLVSMLQDEHTFIYSRDKDLLQVPGTHYSINQGKFIEIDKATSWRLLMEQMLKGDSVDNIIGIPKFGDAKVDALLSQTPIQHLLRTVMNEYCKRFGWFEGLDRFVETYNLISMRMNRGEYFLSKYQKAFDLKKEIKLKLGIS